MQFDWNAPIPAWFILALIAGTVALLVVSGAVAERKAGRRWEPRLFRFTPPQLSEEGCLLCCLVWVASAGYLYFGRGLPLWVALPLGFPIALPVCAVGTMAFQLLCQLIVPAVNWLMDRRSRGELDGVDGNEVRAAEVGGEGLRRGGP